MTARAVPLALLGLLGLLACGGKRAPDAAVEDKLPAGTTARLGGAAFHGEREVSAMAIATGGADGQILLWPLSGFVR